MNFTVNKLTPNIGAEIVGLDIAKGIGEETASKLRETLENNYVVLIRDQKLTPEQQIEYASVYGVPNSTKGYGKTTADVSSKGLPPEILQITNEAGHQMIPILKGAARWHTDMTWSKLPSKGAILHVQKLPAGGTNTKWCALYPAFEALPEKRKAELEKMRVIHSVEAGQSRDNPDASAEEIAWWRQVAPIEHPMVWTHKDGRKSLILGPTWDHVVGMSREESEALREQLEAWCTQPQFVYDHNWSYGDLLVWYNGATMHKAPAYTGPEKRLLYRVTVDGDEEVIGTTPAAA